MSTAGNPWNLARRSAWVVMVLVFFSLAEQGCRNGSPSSDRPVKGGMRDAAIPVDAAKVVTKDVPIDIQAVGTVEASSTVTVKSQVSGELLKVFFREGDFVKKDDELFKIDSRTYDAQLTQQQANLARDEATLAQLEANLTRDIAQQKYAQSESARYASLFDKHLVSKEQTEQSAASEEAASATVRADQAAILSARATVEATKAAIANARVLLSYTSIRSPLDGRTGTVNIKEGNIISPNTELTTINHVEPVYVAFSVPQTRLPSVKKGQAVTVSLQDSTSAPETGNLFFIDNTVDPSTGSILVKASFPNRNRSLWPGLFVRVVLRLGTRQNALIVPGQAVQTGQEGSFVFVVKPDQTVESRPVVPGMRVDDQIVIDKGLQPGETVVTEGQLRLAVGSHVRVR
ncbi:MAG TPA: efflux RND transporter periplasmic adaptor subunit [Acidobacteriota bacterium]|nr:efflux RND transporter periplasmic adaptor subunit [Acidobacteriota bacterium]